MRRGGFIHAEYGREVPSRNIIITAEGGLRFVGPKAGHLGYVQPRRKGTPLGQREEFLGWKGGV